MLPELDDEQPQPLTSEHLVRIGAQLILALIVVAGVVGLCCGAAPPIGWTTQATVVSVHDGDTCRVRIVREFNVRLLDCWAPELRDKGGPEARDSLKRLVEGQEVTLHVPGNFDVTKTTTMGRVLGRVYRDDVDVSEAQRKAGHATAEKEKP